MKQGFLLKSREAPCGISVACKASFVSVSDRVFNESPVAYGLVRNYPNPFNSETVVKYETTNSLTPAHTTLEIFNLMGQKVRTLVDEMKKAGRYEVSWAGRDAQGNPVPSGMYVLHLQAGEQKASGRMIVVR